MKNQLHTIVGTTVYHNRRTAVVQEFHPGNEDGWGIAKDDRTGEKIRFTIKRCHRFMASAEGPVFTGEHKYLEPFIGERITFIMTDKSDMTDGMFLWNYERSYKSCLAECIKLSKQCQHPTTMPPQRKNVATTNHAHRPDPAKKAHKQQHGSIRNSREKNWGYRSALPETSTSSGAMIDLCQELGQRR